MAGNSYKEKIEIQRSVEVFTFTSKVKERIYRNLTSNGSVTFRNIYEIEIWRTPDYTPHEGDFVVYRGKILRVEGFTEDDLHRFQLLRCITLDDFSRNSEGARKIPLYNQVHGDVFHFIDGSYSSTTTYFFICYFFNETGLPVSYVGYKIDDNNTISLVMEQGVQISGTLIIERR